METVEQTEFLFHTILPTLLSTVLGGWPHLTKAGSFLIIDVIDKGMAFKTCVLQPLYFIDLATEYQSGYNFLCLHKWLELSNESSEV